jgi:AcrR family transcriptional regulator
LTQPQEDNDAVIQTASDDRPRLGLRERKKARTRAQLQEHALRLFREQGYEQTTVEQIAEAAEVSPTTVYRYFATKAELVLYDDLDERMISAFMRQPSDLSPIEALRRSVRSGFAGLAGNELELQRERERLLRTEPELRGAMLEEFVRTLHEIAGLLATRAHRPPDDETVVAVAGAVIGVAIAAWFASADEALPAQFIDRLDMGLAALEVGFRL